MQFKKIRRINKSKIIAGGLISLGAIGAITILPSFAKYKVTQDINIANGTVNYKVPDLNIVGLYVKDEEEYIESNTIPSSGYTLNAEKSICKIYDGSTSLENAPIDTSVTINYHDGVLGVDNISKRNTKCYLYFDKEKNGADTILDGISVKTTTPDFSKTATTDEGVYAVEDGMYSGTSYYWRGAVTNNYVKFAGFCWRIVRITGDGSIRLIYDGTTCHENGIGTAESLAKTSVTYNSSYNQSNYIGWTYTGTSQRTTEGTTSNAKAQLENWYSINITGTNAAKVVQGKFCNDRNVQSGDTWTINGSEIFYYAAYKRINKGTPTLNCPSKDVYSLNVGLITADEVMYAGGNQKNNSYYYLYNGQAYWSMSPFGWNGTDVDVFRMNIFGSLDGIYLYATHGLRPVINLRSDITFSSGDGTLNNPYIVQ